MNPFRQRTKHERVVRGGNAKQVLDNPLFKAASNFQVDRAERALLGAKSADEAWLALLTLRAALGQRELLELYVRDGVVASGEKTDLVGEPDAVREREAVERYLKDARAAREDYDQQQGGLEQ